MNDDFVKRLLTTLKCGVCGQRYEASQIQVLGHRDDLWFLSVLCPGCRSQGLVAAVIKEGRAPVVTDLTPEGMERFTQQGAPGVDDLLDLHRFLEEFDGDFHKLFAGKKE